MKINQMGIVGILGVIVLLVAISGCTSEQNVRSAECVTSQQTVIDNLIISSVETGEDKSELIQAIDRYYSADINLTYVESDYEKSLLNVSTSSQEDYDKNLQKINNRTSLTNLGNNLLFLRKKYVNG